MDMKIQLPKTNPVVVAVEQFAATFKLSDVGKQNLLDAVVEDLLQQALLNQ